MLGVRTASVADITQIMKLIWRGAGEGALLKRGREELSSIARKGNATVAVDGAKVVGVAVLDFYSARMSELRSLYVLPGYRGKGVGKMLVEAVAARAEELGVEELMTITLKGNKGWFIRRRFNEGPHGFKVALFRKL